MTRHRDIPPERALLISAVCFVLALICFAVLLSGCASSRTGKALNVAAVGAGAADLVTTEYALARGAREANPLMQGSVWKRIGIKGLAAGTVIGLAQLNEWKGNTALAHLCRVIWITGNVIVSVNNYQVMRRQR